MKSVGIITFHRNNNYGTLLQAYALQKKIEALGYDAELINYIPNNADEPPLYKSKLLYRFRRIPFVMLNIRKIFLKRKAKRKKNISTPLFDEFRIQNVKLSQDTYYGYKMLEQSIMRYDGYVVGSDQTWNPFVTACRDVYFLKFVKDDKRKGSYAPSLPFSSIPEESKKYMECELSKFDYISCREQNGAALLSEISHKNVEFVIDPTLLLSSFEWDETVKSAKVCSKKYILAYFLGDVLWHRKSVERLAQKLDLEVIYLPVNYREIANSKIYKVAAGPAEFLSLVKNAEIVCTDSYHGTLFSINYNKDFYSYCKFNDRNTKSENNRLYSIFEQLGLQDRLVTSSKDVVFHKIDYSKVNDKLDDFKTKSIEYLKKMLDAITEKYAEF